MNLERFYPLGQKLLKRGLKYTDDVSNRKINTSIYAKLAVKRFLNDLESDQFYFDTQKAIHGLSFFPLTNIVKDGEFKPFSPKAGSVLY